MKSWSVTVNNMALGGPCGNCAAPLRTSYGSGGCAAASYRFVRGLTWALYLNKHLAQAGDAGDNTVWPRRLSTSVT